MAKEKDSKPAPKEKAKKPLQAYRKPVKNCPRCGPGKRLAEHKARRSCGKCGYFEKK